MTQLHPYQEQCVKYHLEHHYSIDGCEMGLGKTRIALEAAKRAGGRVAIFGPRFLQSVWEMEAVEVGVDFSYFPYSMLHKVKVRELSGFSFWVADEVHYLKSATANRTHAFYTLLKTLLPMYFVGLSGTPIKNRVPDLWTLLAFCGLNPLKTSGQVLTGSLSKYRQFCRYFCNTVMVEARGARFEKFGAVREDKIPELKYLLRDKYIRFRVDQVLKDLPDLTRKEVILNTVKPPPDLYEVFEAYMAGRKVDSTAKAASALLKASSTVEYVKSMREQGVEYVLIYSDHVESAKAIAREAGGVCITGATSADVRRATVERFQNGELKTITATIGSMSTGVTLTRANHVVFNDLSWVPSDNAQAEKRIHRIGQKSACFAHYIYATTTDYHIGETLTEKIRTINHVIN